MSGGEESEGSEDSSRAIPLWAALGTALALLVAVRLFSFPSVFRGGDVVLLSNDPWVFRDEYDIAPAEDRAKWVESDGEEESEGYGECDPERNAGSVCVVVSLSPGHSSVIYALVYLLWR